jgi:hypothetical protein
LSTLIIGAVVSLGVVAFILLTENPGARLYPAGAAAWRRVLIQVIGALSTGFLLYRFFPDARGSGIPQTKAALFLHDGYIRVRRVLGKFSLCSVSLASGIALGRKVLRSRWGRASLPYWAAARAECGQHQGTRTRDAGAAENTESFSAAY